MTHPANFNLPPGVTARDVEGPEMVECPNPLCQDGKLTDWDGDDHCVGDNCPTCHGSGEVPKEKEQP